MAKIKTVNTPVLRLFQMQLLTKAKRKTYRIRPPDGERVVQIQVEGYIEEDIQSVLNPSNQDPRCLSGLVLREIQRARKGLYGDQPPTRQKFRSSRKSPLHISPVEEHFEAEV